jgi:hypothetical protein
MKINGKTIKVAFALVLVIGTVYWAVSSVLTHSYSGANLDFAVGSGPVKVANPSFAPIPVQLVGSRYGSFSVSSATEGLSGTSIRAGSGTNATYMYEFELPPGVSEFTVVRGTNVNFTANTATKLEATVRPLTAKDTRTTIIVAAVVVLGALFYVSRTTGHRWIGILRRQEIPVPELKPVVESTAGGQGHAIRSYGDNRANIGD